MSSRKPRIIPAGAGPKHNLFGDLVTIKVRGDETGGALAQIETTCGPQVGPPPHVHHREDETFYVIEGDFEFVCGGQTFRGGPGAVAHLPRGIAHSFKNVGESQGRVLVTITPSGFEHFVEEMGALTSEEQGDFPKVAEVAAKHGIEFVRSA